MLNGCRGPSEVPTKWQATALILQMNYNVLPFVFCWICLCVDRIFAAEAVVSLDFDNDSCLSVALFRIRVIVEGVNERSSAAMTVPRVADKHAEKWQQRLTWTAQNRWWQSPHPPASPSVRQLFCSHAYMALAAAAQSWKTDNQPPLG